MDADTQVIYDELCRVAKSGGITHYSDIAPLVGLNPMAPRIPQILESICRHENQAGRPLLSAVVVSKGGGRPGKGFFDLAKGMGLYDGGDDDRFWVQELQRVHACWSSR